MDTKLSDALSPADAALLEAFLDPETTLLDLARRANIPLVTLLDRLRSAPMQAAIDAYRAMADLAVGILSTKARAVGLAVLSDILSTSDNPIERRRAATTIVRSTASPRQPRASAPKSPAGPAAADDPVPAAPSPDPAPHASAPSAPGSTPAAPHPARPAPDARRPGSPPPSRTPRANHKTEERAAAASPSSPAPPNAAQASHPSHAAQPKSDPSPQIPPTFPAAPPHAPHTAAA